MHYVYRVILFFVVAAVVFASLILLQKVLA
jgi:hypothetical protein